MKLDQWIFNERRVFTQNQFSAQVCTHLCFCRMYRGCWTSADRVSSFTLLPILQSVLVLSSTTQMLWWCGSRTATTLNQTHRRRLGTAIWQWTCGWITPRHERWVLRHTSVRSSCCTFKWLQSRSQASLSAIVCCDADDNICLYHFSHQFGRHWEFGVNLGYVVFFPVKISFSKF